MNVRKRGLALLMCICMIFTLLPFSALADATAQDVVYGKYDSTGTTWTKDNSLTAENDAYKNDKTSADVKYSKEAKPVAGEADTYDITLKIESTTTKTSPGASAVVLVIDQSYSMNCCATCNNDEHNYNFVYQHAVGCKTGHTGKVDYEDTRLKAAKDAAKQFADNYATTGSERYLSVVSFCEYSKYLNFGNYFNKIYWVDVSNQKDLKTFKDKIDTIKLDSGTNLSAGLDKAYNLFNNDTVKNISSRYTVVLTDGKPNYPDNSAKAAEDSADNLKTKAKSEVYTVCVGAEDTPFDGTTVGEFLKEKIASKKTGKVYAYNIITKEQLFAAFTAIFADIQLGISSGFTVTDPMGEYVTLDETSIKDNTATVTTENGVKKITWEPKNGTTKPNDDGSKTTTYTLTYKVTLGKVPKDGTYPLNKNTTLKFKDGNKADGSDNNVTLQFNVPGVYREAPKYTVTYKYIGDAPEGAPLPSDNTQYKKGDPVTVKDAPTLDGYTFSGWTPTTESNVTIENGKFTMPANKVVLEGSWTQNNYTVTYLPGNYGTFNNNGTSVNQFEYVGKHYGDATPAAPTTDANSESGTIVPNDGYYFTGWEPERAATVTADAVYTAQYAEKNTITVVANSGEVFYTGSEQSISGFENTVFTINGKVYTVSGLTASVSGTDANDYTNKVTGTAVVTDADGKDVTNQFTVKTKDGTLKIKPIEITLTSASDQKQYDGTPLTNSDVTVTKGAFVDGEGYTANVTGSQTLVGSSDNTFTYTLNEGTKAQNYDITTEKGTLKVIDRTEKYEITVVANNDEVTYDGEVHSVSGFKTLSFTIDGNTYTVSGLNASVSGTDANTYTNAVTGTAVVTDAAGNDVTGQFTVKTQDGTLTIKQAEVTITADNKEKFVDEADPQFTYTISGIVEADKDKKVTLTIIRDKVGTPEGELAGSYSIIPKDASIEGSNNYTFKYVNGTLTIKDRIAKEITLTATKLMDGENATGSDFKFELYQIVGGEEKHIVYKNNNDQTITFTREAHSAGEYIYYIREVAGDKTSINYDETVYAAKVTVTNDDDAGSYSYTVQYYKVVDGKEFVEANGNAAVFNNTTKPTGSLTISKTVSGNAASTTKEFTFKVMLLQNVNMLKGEVTYGNVTFTDGVATFELKHNESVTITGIPAGLNYAVTESDNNGYTVTVNGQNTTMATGTIAAGETSTAAFKNTKNYVYPPNPPIMDEIIVEITGNSDSVVYDGTEHSVKDYTVKISDPRYTEADFTFTGKAEASGINAGTYEMGLKAEQFKNTNARFTNVKFVIKADGVLTITPKDLTITAGSKTEYGPTPVTCDEWTVSGLVAGDKVESVKITGIQSVPGSSPNVPSDAVIKNAKGEDVTKNYAIKYVNGTLTMLEVLNKEDHFNYIIGTPEGLSLPTANVTRAEVATIFFRLMTDDARAKFDSLDNSFSDVAKGKWYNRAISTLAKAGIIKGDPAGTYRPGDPITRAEMAAIIARFGDFKEGGKTFNDISGHWAQKYIELAASNGWINGNPDGTFKPNNNITRAETVAMINRVLDRQTKDVSDLLPVSQMTNWSDNMDTAKWYYRDMQEATNNHKAERVGNSIYEKWTEKLPDIDWASYQI